MKKNLCSSCRYWSKDPKQVTGNCLHPKLQVQGPSSNLLDSVELHCFDRGSWFNTGPSFGCVHWEKFTK